LDNMVELVDWIVEFHCDLVIYGIHVKRNHSAHLVIISVVVEKLTKQVVSFKN
jgi:hypothetical protein